MIVLHTYTHNRVSDQQETIAAIRELERNFGYVVESVLCDRQDSYWRALSRNWGRGDLILIEQDIVPMYDHLHQLATCGFPACTVPYRVNGHWSVGNSIYDNVLAVGPTGDSNLGMLQPISTEWYDSPLPRMVEVSGFGLVKISKELQDRIPIHAYPVPLHHWSILDTWFSAYMNVLEGLGWHLHTPPVKHNHDNEQYYSQPTPDVVAQF